MTSKVLFLYLHPGLSCYRINKLGCDVGRTGGTGSDRVLVGVGLARTCVHVHVCFCGRLRPPLVGHYIAAPLKLLTVLWHTHRSSSHDSRAAPCDERFARDAPS